ncbi:hypothetical protein [Oceanobacillus halophilus]|uniref:Nucleoside transporter/FeoB GTPase Gate domain-containing protein n=1 Tax=Oceanobacillus halophilus TaxID=930130 RepID=A0A495ABS7_9BACI|nr:hypothetical protein [Oceanobacillus halophilus]RKQ35866.1 hypothetical protein D8M06_06340 [Oceanobacillus halophilus]
MDSKEPITKGSPKRKKWHVYEILGLFIVALSLILLFFAPSALSELFDVIIQEVKPVVIDTFLLSEVGIAIIVSVIVGRMLERFGFTDGLIRIFVPIMKAFKINPSVIIPSSYNILGDINAAGKIAGPILVKAKATKAEQKIAVATMIQSPQSFATFVLGIIALSIFGISVFPLVLLSIFAPLIIVPWILSKTMYRDTKKVDLEELPRFTPKTKIMNTIFSSAKEGTELLLLTIIPAVAVVFFFIGALNYFGIWGPIEASLGTILTTFSIEPSTGIISILAAPTLAVAQLAELSASIDPRLIVGSFVLANSGLPLSVIFGQVPVTWAETTDLNEREVLGAAVIGMVIRVITACIIGYFLTPLLVV